MKWPDVVAAPSGQCHWAPSVTLAVITAFSMKKPPLYHPSQVLSPSVGAMGMRCRPRHFNSLMSVVRGHRGARACPALGCGRNDLGTLALPDVTPSPPSSPSQMAPSLSPLLCRLAPALAAVVTKHDPSRQGHRAQAAWRLPRCSVLGGREPLETPC